MTTKQPTKQQRIAQIEKALQVQSKDTRTTLLKNMLFNVEYCEIAEATNDLLYKHFVYDYNTYFDNTSIIYNTKKSLV